MEHETQNVLRVSGKMLVLTSKNGEEILADVGDMAKITRYTWCISKTGYAVANIGGKVVKMHRYLLDVPAGKVVDHINGNTLDNRRSNLRVCEQSENMRNMGRKKNNRPPYPGVQVKQNGRYRVRITVDRKEIAIGTYDTEEEAIRARIDAENRYYGVFAPTLSRGLSRVLEQNR